MSPVNGARSTSACCPTKPGDWVIIHMGFVVEKTDKDGADATLAGLELMGRGREQDSPP
jgi:hydrogenase expression/formation protein HypC